MQNPGNFIIFVLFFGVWRSWQRAAFGTQRPEVRVFSPRLMLAGIGIQRLHVRVGSHTYYPDIPHGTNFMKEKK